jgi:hypothetical protein
VAESTGQVWRGGNGSSRAFLAMGAMLGAWLLSSVALLLLRLTFEPGRKLGGRARMSATVAGCSDVFFVIPVTALFPRRVPLRFTYGLVALSFAWSGLALRVLFAEWPWKMLRAPLVGVFVPCWFGGFTLCAVGVYLCLLGRGARMDELPRVFAWTVLSKRNRLSSGPYLEERQPESQA